MTVLINQLPVTSAFDKAMQHVHYRVLPLYMVKNVNEFKTK